MSFFSEGFTKSKLTVLYFLKELSVNLTKDQIATFSTAYDLIPYFELHSAVYELEEEGFLAAVPRPYGQTYCLTPKGEETLEMFVERLPQSMRDNITDYADECREKLRLETQFSTSVEKVGTNGACRLTLRAMEQHGDLLQISILLPDNATASHASALWPERAEFIYKSILSELLREKESNET
ncbi:MAG: DUF4364 family protein [Clostridiales bacterium]|nr:DUF4364 family protein [Clostridiales bacterium]